jgi:insulin receptor substrate 1
MARPSKQQPTVRPRRLPSSQPSRQPSSQPPGQPATRPRSRPSSQPSWQPLAGPSSQPSIQPRTRPSSQPSRRPSAQPSKQPIARLTAQPSSVPSRQPTARPAGPSTHRAAQTSSVVPANQTAHCWAILFSPELIRHPSRKTAICPAIQATYRPATVQPSSQPHCPTCRSTPLPCPDRALSRKAVLEQRHHVSHSIHPAVFVPFSSAIISNLCRPAVPPSYLPHPVVYHPSNSVTISPIQPSIVQQRLVQQ